LGEEEERAEVAHDDGDVEQFPSAGCEAQESAAPTSRTIARMRKSQTIRCSPPSCAAPLAIQVRR
jgi:hypothetical protein